MSRPLDPRYFQMMVLSSLLVYGTLALNFDIPPLTIVVALSTVLATQALGSIIFHVTPFDPRSAIISGLSLCLLLRSNNLLVIALAAIVAVGSKFVIRFHGKHIFNPTNLGIAVAVLFSGSAWISPGQWGNESIFAAFVACAGAMVVNRAARSDMTVFFFVFHGALLLARAVWLGDPLTIPFHQLQSGALIIFAFFMISDPRPTPNHWMGRAVFAMLVALLAYYIRFKLFNPNALIFALVAISPLTPLIDWLFPGSNYRWSDPSGEHHQGSDKRFLSLSTQGIQHA